MRINIAGEEEIPADVIIHGKIPKAPARSCKNCSKKATCKILQYSLSHTATVDFRPNLEGAMMEYEDMSFPMPCHGLDWSAIGRVTEINDPLVQRLGLANIGEPNIEYPYKKEGQE